MSNPVRLVSISGGPTSRSTCRPSRRPSLFCLEIYHVHPDKSVELLHKDDFCFK